MRRVRSGGRVLCRAIWSVRLGGREVSLMRWGGMGKGRVYGIFGDA